MNFRSCGDCTICCSGTLIGDAFGHPFGNGKKCHYLVENKCTVYNDRPSTCKKYQCAWSQGLLPEHMRPDRCGVIVSVEGNPPHQYLKSIKFTEADTTEVYDTVDHFCNVNNAKHVKAPFMMNQQQPPTSIEPFISVIASLGRKDLAIEVLDLLYDNSKTFGQYYDLSVCYYKLNDYPGIVKAVGKSIDHSPNADIAYDLRVNLASSHVKFNEPGEALKHIELLEKVRVDADLLINKQFALFLLNRKDEAEEVLKQAAALPDLTEQQRTTINFNFGSYHFRKDRFQEGLKSFILEGGKLNFWKTNNSQFFKDKGTFSGIKEWDGEYVEDGTILIHCEAGIGDEIIGARFCKHIRDMGMRPVWYSDSAGREDIKEIFKRNGIEILEHIRDIKNFKNVRWLHSMHLPLVMKCEYKDLWYGPYIKPDDGYVAKWKDKLTTNKKLKIGIRWQGAPHYEQDLHRSIPLKDIYEAIGHLDAEFYSLQKDNGMDELKDFPGIVDLSDDLNSWDDTLGAMHNMDFIVSSCTSIPHMALASGVKTYVLPPLSTYYTWCNNQKVNPWYGENAIVLPQEVNKSWKEPLEKLKALLK